MHTAMGALILVESPKPSLTGCICPKNLLLFGQMVGKVGRTNKLIAGIIKMEYVPFAKLARLSRSMVITEKLDGTNAQVYIKELHGPQTSDCLFAKDRLALYAGSRTRYITPDNDNYGFAKWAKDHAEELITLGEGRHYGEWWGNGINRGYGLGEKRFSLFNVSRWGDVRPSCCSVVPVLFDGEFSTEIVEHVLSRMKENGSYAAPGFMNPEGVVIFHTAAGVCFKKTLEKDESPKSRVSAEATHG